MPYPYWYQSEFPTWCEAQTSVMKVRSTGVNPKDQVPFLDVLLESTKGIGHSEQMAKQLWLALHRPDWESLSLSMGYFEEKNPYKVGLLNPYALYEQGKKTAQLPLDSWVFRHPWYDLRVLAEIHCKPQFPSQWWGQVAQCLYSRDWKPKVQGHFFQLPWTWVHLLLMARMRLLMDSEMNPLQDRSCCDTLMKIPKYVSRPVYCGRCQRPLVTQARVWDLDLIQKDPLGVLALACTMQDPWDQSHWLALGSRVELSTLCFGDEIMLAEDIPLLSFKLYTALICLWEFLDTGLWPKDAQKVLENERAHLQSQTINDDEDFYIPNIDDFSLSLDEFMACLGPPSKDLLRQFRGLGVFASLLVFRPTWVSEAASCLQLNKPTPP